MNKKLGIALAFGGLAFAAQAAAQVTFYENESFHGRSFTTQQGVRDFGQFGFNDRASSAMVTGTRWEVCDDVRFRGNCMVLRPGYPSPASLGLNNRISSARAVHQRALQRQPLRAEPAAHVTSSSRRTSAAARSTPGQVTTSRPSLQ
jgi:hypothetical protein